MFKRHYIGLDIRSDKVSAALLQRCQRGFICRGQQLHELPETVLNPSFLQPNIGSPDEFIAAVQKVIQPFKRKDKRIAVSLPDAAGHVFLIDSEDKFKSRREGIELIRWRLKEMLPGRCFENVCIDYQVLPSPVAGKQSLSTVVIFDEVLDQYEKLLIEAGYAPQIICFHSLALANVYRNWLAVQGEVILIVVNDGQLIVQAYRDGVLHFYRQRKVSIDSITLDRELYRSLVALSATEGLEEHCPVYLHCDLILSEQIYAAVQKVFDQPVSLIAPLLAEQLIKACSAKDLGISSIAAFASAQQLSGGDWL